MRPRFQADADFNHKILVGLRRRDARINFQDAIRGGVIGKPDPEVLSIAAEAGRILVSHDRSTMLSHFARFTGNHTSPGLIIVAQDLDLGRAIEELYLIWMVSELEEWEGKIGFVPI